MKHTRQEGSSRIAVVILNWNGYKDTLECLESLYKNQTPGMEIYVADNGSSDDSVVQIRSHYPSCHLLELGQNFGFAEGNNLAVQQALHDGCEFILLLNNDTIVTPDLLDKFLKAYQKLGPYTALGAKIGYYGEKQTVWDFGALWNEKSGNHHKVARHQLMDSLHEVVEVDLISGCAMFIPAFIIRQLGLFDRRFFLNYEETDWCVRAKRAGVKLYSIPDAVLWHKISKSFCGSIHNQYFVYRNRGLWLHNFTLSQRMKWFWLHGQFKNNLILTLKTLVCLITLPLWIFFRELRAKQIYRLARTGIRLVSWSHHLMGRYGDCPDWVRVLASWLKKGWQPCPKH